MSQHSYERSKVLGTQDEPFSAYIMAAMRKADTYNAARFRSAFPEIAQEFYERYWCGGGLTVDEGGTLEAMPYEEYAREQDRFIEEATA
jgi:hypothetical protein